MKRKPDEKSAPRVGPLGRLFFLVLLVVLGLAAGTQRSLRCDRPVAPDQVTCSIQLEAADQSYWSWTAEFVRHAVIGDESKTTSRASSRNVETTYHDVLKIVGDETITSRHLEDLGPVRAFLDMPSRSSADGTALVIQTPRDIRRVVASWLFLGLAALVALGWVLELIVGRERLYQVFGLSPDDDLDDAPLPDVPAWRPIAVLLVLAALGSFFVWGQRFFGPTAVGKVEALHTAVEAGDPDAVRAALARGTDPNAPDDQHRAPLVRAARVGPMDIVATLLAAGARPNAASRTGDTALQSAVASGDRQRIELLLAAGAAPSLADDGGATPLSIAAYAGDAEAVRVLLAAGADPHRPLQLGRNLLHAAAAGGSVEAFEQIHQAAPDLDLEAVGDEGRSVWDMAGMSPTGSGPMRDHLRSLGVGPAG